MVGHVWCCPGRGLREPRVRWSPQPENWQFGGHSGVPGGDWGCSGDPETWGGGLREKSSGDGGLRMQRGGLGVQGGETGSILGTQECRRGSGDAQGSQGPGEGSGRCLGVPGGDQGMLWGPGRGPRERTGGLGVQWGEIGDVLGTQECRRGSGDCLGSWGHSGVLGTRGGGLWGCRGGDLGVQGGGKLGIFWGPGEAGGDRGGGGHRGHRTWIVSDAGPPSAPPPPSPTSHPGSVPLSSP